MRSNFQSDVGPAAPAHVPPSISLGVIEQRRLPSEIGGVHAGQASARGMAAKLRRVLPAAVVEQFLRLDRVGGFAGGEQGNTSPEDSGVQTMRGAGLRLGLRRIGEFLLRGQGNREEENCYNQSSHKASYTGFVVSAVQVFAHLGGALIYRTCWALFALLVLLYCSTPVNAQNTTVVTGTITDSNGIPYANATVQAQLLPTGVTPTEPPPCNGQSATNCTVSAYQRGTANAAGVFSMTLASNAVLSPGGTTWQITVTETGTPPPLGTGPQSCSATVSVSGASQSLTSSFNACPALSNASGGLTPVASLPGTCTQASLPVLLTVAPGGVYYPVVSNGTCNWQGGPHSGSNVYNVRNYGGYGDTQIIGTNYTWTTQNSICSPLYSFTSADIGKTVYQSGGGGASQYGIIGGTSGGCVTSVTGYNGAYPGYATTLVWGHLDDPAGPAISALIQAQLGSNSSGTSLGPYNFSPIVYFPAGGYMLCGTAAKAEFLTLTPPTGGMYVTIMGDATGFGSAQSTVIYPCPVLPSPGYQATVFARGLGGYPFGVNFLNLQYNGLGEPFNNDFYAIFSGSYFNNVSCINVEYSTYGIPMGCVSGSTATQIYNATANAGGLGDGFGFEGGNIEVHQSRTSNYSQGSGVVLTNVNGATASAGFRWIGGQIDESGCNAGNSQYGNVNLVNSFSVWFVDTAIFTCPGFDGVYVDPTSVIHLNGDEIGPYSNGAAGLYIAAGGKAIVTDTRLYAFASSLGYCVNNLGTFVNLGGNRCEEYLTGTASESGNTVTVTTAQNHRLTTANIGDYASVVNMSVAGYNCSAQYVFCWQITGVPSGTTFTYNDPTGSLGAATGGSIWVNTWNGGAFTGNPPTTDLTPTWNTCYYTPTWANSTTMNLCSQPNDRGMYLSRVRATSNVVTSCATPPVVTLTNGNTTVTLTLTSGQSVWDTSASPSTFPIASGSLPQYYAPTLPSATNSPTISIATNTCVTLPVNFEVTTFATSPGTP